MSASGLTGSRIRERRVTLKIKQTVLAQTVGISAAYLNLIEHNKRRIGGKLLSDIAEALSADVAMLAEGAEAGLVIALREAASRDPTADAELGQLEEFAGRFPGWARLLTQHGKAIDDLERSVAILTDRLANDPYLSDSLHDLLSTVTAISATSAILVETDRIEDEWRDRFHRNIYEDSQRLSDSSQALTAYLDTVVTTQNPTVTPLEEVGAWLEARDYRIPEPDGQPAESLPAIIKKEPGITTPAGEACALAVLPRFSEDARRIPMSDLQDACSAVALDPIAIARQFNVDFATALRRIAMMPTPKGAGRLGLVICDGSGATTFQKPTDGFPLPRVGAGCPLWPLYQSLHQPMQPLRSVLEIAGREPFRFLTFSVAQPMNQVDFSSPPLFEATMLIVPADRADLPETAATTVGASCRICPKDHCDARREPSILQLQ